jgi:hypothetical protein
MKVPPVVAAYKFEIILTVIGVGVGIYLINKIWSALPDAETVKEAAKEAAKVVKDTVAPVNPLDQRNIAATTANAIYRTVSGKKSTDDSTLATWITDFTDVNNYDPNKD